MKSTSFRRAHAVRSLVLSSLFAFSLIPAIASAMIITVGGSGVPENCTEPTLALAIQKAVTTPEADEIWITRDVTGGGDHWTNVAMQLNNLDVKIVGGYEDCWAPTPTGRTRLSGVGGVARSVIEIRGGGVVELHNLDITDGDEASVNGTGGGVDYVGHGALVLNNVRLENNKAGNGGGLFFDSEGGDGQASLAIDDNVWFIGNDALDDGGAIYLAGRSHLVMTGQSNYVFDNEAAGHGGGIYISSPARADVGAGGIAPYHPVFHENRAVRGAAFAVQGSDTSVAAVAHLNLFSSYGDRSMRVISNIASASGGGIYAKGYADGLTINEPRLCIWDTWFEGNQAPDGAAIHLSTDEKLGSKSDPDINVNNPDATCPKPPVVIPCPGECTAFIGNLTRRVDGSPVPGGVIDLGDTESEHLISDFVAVGNIAGAFISAGSGPSVPGAMNIRACLIYGNSFSRHVINLPSSIRTRIRHCTIADNEVDGAVLALAGESNRVSSITKSILVAAPGQNVLQRSGPPSGFDFSYVIASEIGSMPATEHVMVADPGFVDPANGNYHLRNDSTAVDFSPSDEMTHDLAGNPRTSDTPRPNRYGPRDLGAYENQNTFVDVIFSDDFE